LVRVGPIATESPNVLKDEYASFVSRKRRDFRFT